MLTEDRVKELEVLQNKFKFKFHDINLLNQSLTHKSYVNENINENLQDNERLEFLGDSVLSLIVSDYSIKRFINYSEGELTKIRAAVVSEANLSLIARELEIGRFLLLGKGEEMTGGRDKTSLLANAFEAVIAAIYLDSGYKERWQLLLPQMHWQEVKSCPFLLSFPLLFRGGEIFLSPVPLRLKRDLPHLPPQPLSL